ncbi:MAG: hypothetical protein II996_06640 [Oscillospiraceae bacterium]|nr:hypothetical protein [Oscillospiraceae bacterium]MBQ4545230.1 hypothetical protein [Oscillospiraceae bacterium]MBQ6901907.1 hypothetical protein [Oscillospiraceae bacterium]
MGKLEILKEKLKNREKILTTTVGNISWSGIIELISRFSFDGVVIDIEHGTISVEGAEALLRTCRLCDLPGIVRISDCVSNIISKTLDMGADGIIVPRVESVEQVECAVSAMRYFPRGRKGCGGFSNLRAEDCGSVHKYNDNRLLFIQIESKEGLCVLPEILEKYRDELSGVLIGPYDASIMLGTPLDILSDEMTEFIGKVFSICNKKKISCGSFVDDKTLIPRYEKLGGNFFWTATEISLLSESYRSLCDAFSKK